MGAGGRKAALLSTLYAPTALKRRLGLDKLPKGGLKVLDALSIGYRAEGGDREGIILLQTPVTLESLLASIERAHRMRGSYDLLILDSLDLLLSRFPMESVLDFFRTLQLRMADKDVTLVVLDRSKARSCGPGSQLASLFEHTLDLSCGGEDG